MSRYASVGGEKHAFTRERFFPAVTSASPVARGVVRKTKREAKDE
jgi:hypothetical protein